MNKSDIDKICSENSKNEAISQLEELLKEEYDEYLMFRLAQLQFIANRSKEAIKCVKKALRLFPTGEYLLEFEELLKNGYTEENNPKKEQIHSTNEKNMETKPQTISLATQFRRGEKKKKERKIPRNIQECFEDTVGMETVAKELDSFYNVLRLQQERKNNDFQAELIRTTNFAVIGKRGSGKTMVGKIIARLLCDFGIRDSEEPVFLDALELSRAYESDKEQGIKTLFGQLTDATVIIEKMDLLLEPDENGNVGCLREIAIELERVMKEKREEISLILTGSEKSIKKLFEFNATLEDCLFGQITIPGYSVQELAQIGEKLAKERALLIHESAKKNFMRRIEMEYRSSEFLNSISLGRYLDEASINMAERLSDLDSIEESQMVTLRPEDFNVEVEEENLGELLEQLDNMVGLHSIKEQLRKRIVTLQAEEQAREAGSQRKETKMSLHMLFKGNPGTGKTTVANLLGKIYQQLGILPRGNRMVSCTRSDLVGKYQGHTAKLVHEKVKEAMGGILFIDEAYALCRDDGDTFGHEAVDELIAAMENNRDNLMVILAGYSEEMDEFIKSNPGFASRIRNEIIFEDYTTAEMVQIAENMVKSRGMRFAPDTESTLYELLETKSKVPDFGNARGVRNVMDDVLEGMNERLANASAGKRIVTRTEYDVITKEDLQKILDKKTTEEKSLNDLLKELSELTGLSGAKAKVQELVDDLEVKKAMKEHGLDVDDGHGTLHLVFKGNAGTGKTTVARLLGQIYCKLGVLKKNVFVETGRKDLVGSYQGHTAKNVMKKIKEAEGGILFIDEAYTLVNGEHDDFGKEAVSTLVAELENRRESLMVILAGYGKDMDQFLDVNQGLASRLANEIVFEDYSEDELYQIYGYQVRKAGLISPIELEETVRELIRKRMKEKDFGNARGIRNIVEQVEKRKNSRIAVALRNKEQLSKEQMITLVEQDFNE